LLSEAFNRLELPKWKNGIEVGMGKGIQGATPIYVGRAN